MTSPTTITASRERHAATRTAREPGGRWWWIGGLALLAGLAYVPLLAVRPGVITPDTKTYLYLDPLRFLSQVPFMWNPTVALGTVSHEYIGYLLPMGPFYAVFHLLGVPVWVAQRLWLGSILFAAGIGILYLCRILGLRGPGPIAGALLYMLSPYFLQYAGRISVILLPWAGLPFMLGLTIVALRRGGWRQPALFAIVVALVSGINATSIIYVGVVPVLWLLYAVVVLREATWRRALGTAVRIGILTLGACVWWMAGLEIEAAYGVNVLKYTETVPSTSATSNAADILRGLGYWYFYGTDHLGPWTNAAVRYTQNIALLATSFAVPALAVLGAAFVRWRERAFFLVILFVGSCWPSGPFPYSHPTALGGWLKSFMTNTTAGLALRSTDRATPVVLLALAILLASVAHRVVAPPQRRRHHHRGGDRLSGDRQQPLALQRRHHRQQFHPAGVAPLLPAGRDTAPQQHASGHTGLRHPGQRLRLGPLGRHHRHASAGSARPRLRHPRAADHGLPRHGRHALRRGLADPGRHRQHERTGPDGSAHGCGRPHGRIRPALRALRRAPTPTAGAPLLQTPLGLSDPTSFGSPRPNVSTVSTLNEQDLSIQGNDVGWPAPLVTYTVKTPAPCCGANRTAAPS